MEKRIVWEDFNFGSKNANLPILAATILSNQVKLTNIPLVRDIFYNDRVIKIY